MHKSNGHNALKSASAPDLALPLDGTPHVLSEIGGKGNGRNGNRTVAADAHPMGSTEPTTMQFEAFADGTIADLVRDAAAPEKLKLVIWQSGQFHIQSEFCHAGRVLIPCPIEPSLLAAVRLPTAVLPCGNALHMLGQIKDCIRHYVDLTDDELHLASSFVLCTWLQDRHRVAPYLWLIGPLGSGKTTLLRLLHALCRRGITLGDLTAASLYALPSTIVPTLLIDEFESGSSARNHDVLRLLRTGSTKGVHAVRGARIFETFCAKVISSRTGPQDTALASRAIFISMRPTRKALPHLGEDTLEEIAQRFQPQLLRYRLENYLRSAGQSQMELPNFTSRMSDLASALAVPLLGDKSLEHQLEAVLSPQDEEAKLSRHSEPEWATATGLFEECHTGCGILTAGDLCSTVNGWLAQNGEPDPLTPRAVGDVLRSLGFRTEKLGNRGRGLRLTRAVKRQIHQVARDLGLKRSDILDLLTVDAGYGGPPCWLCEEFGLMIREDGEKLRCVKLAEHKPVRHGGPFEPLG